MMRSLRLLLGVSLLLCSWPAAAVERAAEVRAAPPASVLAPAALPGISLPELRALGTGVSGGAALAVPPLPAPQAPAGAVAAGPASFSFKPVGPSARAAEAAPKSGVPLPGPETYQHAPGHVDNSEAVPTPAVAGAELEKAGSPGRTAEPRAQASAAAGDAGAAFDGASKRSAAVEALPVAAPAAAFGAAVLPLAAAHAHHAARALVPAIGQGSYLVGNALSAILPLPDIYRALKDPTKPGAPLTRTLLGAGASFALGVVNATVLGQPFWGVIHVFIGLGMTAPVVIRKLRAGRPAPAVYIAPRNLAPGARLFHRLRGDRAIRRSAAWGLGLGVLAAAIFAGAWYAVPAGLAAAHLTGHALSVVLTSLQIAKGALFGAIFGIDAVAMARGKRSQAFSTAFTTIFLASSLAYAAWGFSLAALSPDGTARDQHLINAFRNLLTAVASAVSAWYMARRARRDDARR